MEKHRILIIDDDQEITQLIVKKILMNRRNVYKFFVGADGYEGLDIIKSKKINLAILDIRMHNMDGVSLCRILKKEGYLESLIVIISSGYISDTQREELKVLGVSHFIDKPYSPDDLISLMDSLLNYQPPPVKEND